MNFYQSLGHLVLGSRLRRVSEYFFAEINKIYAAKNIPFEASWFPVFYCLSQQPAISIRDLANQVQVSHSAMSQLVSSLKKKGWVQSQGSNLDGRKQVIELTPEGQTLLDQVLPIWNDIKRAMYAIQNEHPETAPFMESLQALENVFDSQAFSDRVINQEPYECI